MAAAGSLLTLPSASRTVPNCSADSTTLDCRPLIPTPPPPTPAHAGDSRSTVDTAVSEQSRPQLLRRLHHSQLPSTDTTADFTDTLAAAGPLSKLPVASGAVPNCSTDSTNLDCRSLTPLPPPPTPTHAGGSWSTVATAVGEQSRAQLLRRRNHSRLPSADTTTASTDTRTRGGSRSTVDTAVGEQSCAQLPSRLHHSRLPCTDTTATSTNTYDNGGSRSTVDTAINEQSCAQLLRRLVDSAIGEQSCAQLLRRLHHSRLSSSDTTAASNDTDAR